MIVKMMFLLLAVALLLLIGPAFADQGMGDYSSVQSGKSTAEHIGEPTTVLIFGDSNTFGYMPVAFETHGYRYPYKARWTTMVAESLGSDYNIVVNGLMGRTIDVLKRKLFS
jgi:hypothetical protein